MTPFEIVTTLCFFQTAIIFVFSLVIHSMKTDVVRLGKTLEEDSKYISDLEKRSMAARFSR